MSPISLAVQSKGKGYPILCLHGHPGSSQSMSVFTEHLSQRFLTITPDLRGYGRSRTFQDFKMAEHLLDLEAVLDNFALETCLVLGWSLGGILAIELALKLPQRVSGLIIVASAARPRSSLASASYQDNFYAGVASLINKVKPGWSWNIETFAKRSLYRYLLQQHTAHAYHRLAHEGFEAYLKTSGFATRALKTALRTGYNRLPDLHQIHCPCLLLAGECDRHITFASSQETAQRLPQCQLISYPSVAHLFPWEVPHQVLGDIDRWILEHPEAVSS